MSRAVVHENLTIIVLSSFERVKFHCIYCNAVLRPLRHEEHHTLTLMSIHGLLTIGNDLLMRSLKPHGQYTTSVLIAYESIHDSCDNTSLLVFAFPILVLFQWQCEAFCPLSGLSKPPDSRANETQKLSPCSAPVSFQKHYYVFHSLSTSSLGRVFIQT